MENLAFPRVDYKIIYIRLFANWRRQIERESEREIERKIPHLADGHYWFNLSIINQNFLLLFLTVAIYY